MTLGKCQKQQVKQLSQKNSYRYYGHFLRPIQMLIQTVCGYQMRNGTVTRNLPNKFQSCDESVNKAIKVFTQSKCNEKFSGEIRQ